MEFLLEAFDEDNRYGVVNLNPKMNPPQVFQLMQEGDASPIVVKFGGTSTLGEKITKLTKADKALQIVLFSLSPKGNFAELKNGLGDDPIKTISTIIGLTKEITKTQQIDSIMFRYPAKKMQGKGPQLQRIFKAICKRTLPSFTTLDEISEFDGGKHGYVVLYKKAKGLDNSALPSPDKDRFTKVETSVGETYVDDKTGKSISKPEAIAITITDTSSKQSDKEIMLKTRISRRAMIQAQGQFIEPDFSISPAAKKTQADFDVSAKMTPTTDEDKDDKRVANIISSSSDHDKGILDLSVDIDSWINEYKTDKPDYMRPYSWPETTLWKEFSKTNPNPSVEDQIKLKDAIEIYYKVSREITQGNAVEKLALLMSKLKLLSMDQFSTASVAKTMTQDIMLALTGKMSGADGGYIPGLSTAQFKLIKEYSGAGYKAINHALLGLDSFTKPIQTKVTALDSIINMKGIKLPDDIVLYRLQRVKSGEAKRLLENKVFYFRNFVSTSLKPLIFTDNSFGASASISVDAPEFDSNVQSPEEFVSDVQKLEQSKSKEITYAFAISKASRIKSLVLGETSSHSIEAEVLLPRGTTLKINKIYGRDSGVMDYDNKTMLLISEVMDPELLDESFDVYDGDTFLSEGTLVPIKKSLFATMYESTDKPTEDGYDLLASIINTDVPDKFIN